MQKQLQLADSTAIRLLGVGREQLRQTSLLNSRKDGSVEDRQQALQQIQQQFHERVQNLLSLTQWNQYKALEEAMRNKFINNTSDKKIAYKEL